MPDFVYIAVLGSTLFQSSWNFFAKKSRAGKVVLIVIGFFPVGLILGPIAWWTLPATGFEFSWIKYILATGVIHAAYFCALGWAYEVGEISVVYPVSRGLAIVGTTVVSLALGRVSLSAMGLTGVLSVASGTFAIGMRKAAPSGKRAFFAAGVVAITVCTYTLVDSWSVSVVPPLVLMAGMNLSAPLIALPLLLWKFRPEVHALWARHKLEAFGIGLGGTTAYLIILWAYQRAPAPYVASLREFSVVIASFLGVVFLREQRHWQKVLGIALILAGIVLIKLA